jgi:hypothetical protein
MLARKLIAILLLILSAADLSLADTTTFRHVKLVEEKGHQTKASLTLSDDNKLITVKPAKGEAVSIPYDHADRFSYEYTKKHRIGTGTIVLLAVSIVGGIVIMCTQSKKHWLDIDYTDQNSPRNVVLRLDKKNYEKIIDAVKTHTGKDVEIVGCRLCKMKN